MTLKPETALLTDIVFVTGAPTQFYSNWSTTVKLGWGIDSEVIEDSGKDEDGDG